MTPSWPDKYVGIPFEDKGRDHNGADCWGLLRLVYMDQLNICLDDFSADYVCARDVENIRAIIRVQTWLNWMRVKLPREFDAVLIQINGDPWHCGVYIGDYNFLHTDRKTDAIIERTDAPRWQPRIQGFYRYVKQ